MFDGGHTAATTHPKNPVVSISDAISVRCASWEYVPNVGPTTLQWQGFWSVPHWKHIGKKGSPTISPSK